MKPPAASRREKKGIGLMMAPMIDIIFNLLIFFLLTPTFYAKEGYLATNLPRATGGVGTQDRIKIFLEVPTDDDKGVIIIFDDRKEMLNSFDSLLAKLRDKKSRGLRADYPVLIAPSSAVRHKWVVRAFDTAIGAGFSNIQFTGSQ